MLTKQAALAPYDVSSLSCSYSLH